VRIHGSTRKDTLLESVPPGVTTWTFPLLAPVGTVAVLYRHFGLPLAPGVAAAVGKYARERPQGGYGPRDYRFEDHGLDTDTERQKFRGYTERFGIAV